MASKCALKKGDARKFILGIVIITFLLALGIIGYTLSIGTLSYVGDITEATGEADLMEREEFQGSFEIEDVRFHMPNATITEGIPQDVCEEKDKKLPILVDLRILSRNVGSNCEFFIDGAYAEAIEIKDLPEEEEKLQQTIYTTSLKKHKISSSYEIRVCCHTECYEKEIKKLC